MNQKVKDFFEKELIPKSIKIKEHKEIISWMSIDKDIDSYYENRMESSVNKVDFETNGGSSLEAFESDLTSLWGNENDSELITLIPSLVNISKDLYNISEFIYVMF